MDDIYDHSFVSTIQHHVHHISNTYTLQVDSYRWGPSPNNGNRDSYGSISNPDDLLPDTNASSDSETEMAAEVDRFINQYIL